MKLLFHVLAALILFSCSKGTDDPMRTATECINAIKSNFITQCPDTNDFTKMYLCQIDSVGELYLDESSKEFLPQFCRTSNQALVFVNAKGQIINLKPSSKSYSFYHSTYNSFHPCPGDSTRNFGSCFGKEAVFFYLKSEAPPLTMYIQLETIPNTIYPYDHKFGDVLNIYRQISTTSYSGDFRVIVNQRSLDKEKFDFQEFYPEIKLNEKTFYKVMSLDITKYQIRPYKYYYNKEIGLIGFEDLAGVLWVIAK